MHRRKVLGIIGGVVASAAVGRQSGAQGNFFDRIAFRTLGAADDGEVAGVMCQNPLLCHDVEWGDSENEESVRWESEVLGRSGSSIVMTIDGATLGYCDIPYEDYVVRDEALSAMLGADEIRAFRVEAAGIRIDRLPKASLEYEQLAWALLLNRVFVDASARGRTHSWVSAPFVGFRNVMRGNWSAIEGMTIVPDRWRFPARTENGVSRADGADEKGQAWFVQVFEVVAAIAHTQREVEALGSELDLL